MWKHSDVQTTLSLAPASPLFIRVLRGFGSFMGVAGVFALVALMLMGLPFWAMLVAANGIFGYGFSHALASISESLIAIRQKLERSSNNPAPPADPEEHAATLPPIIEK